MVTKALNKCSPNPPGMAPTVLPLGVDWLDCGGGDVVGWIVPVSVVIKTLKKLPIKLFLGNGVGVLGSWGFRGGIDIKRVRERKRPAHRYSQAASVPVPGHLCVADGYSNVITNTCLLMGLPETCGMDGRERGG
jgi:hypothetical protein